MSNSIRIKRRASDGDAGVSGVTLKNGELAYNEADDILYYGYGISGSNAAQIKGIGGVGRYVNLTTAQTISGVKTLTSILNANGGVDVNGNGSQGIRVYNSGTLKFSVAGNDGDVVTAGSLTAVALGISGNANVGGTLGVTGVTTLTGALNANGGITTTSGNLALNSADGLVDINDAVDISGQLDVSGALATGSTLGVTGVTTLGGLLNANAGIAVDTNKFTVQDATGNIYTAGTLAVAGTTDLVGDTNVAKLNIDGNLHFSGTTITIDALDAASTVQSKFVVLNGTKLETRTAALTRSDIGANNATNLTAGLVNTARLPVATATAKGAIELFSNTVANAAEGVTTTANQTYGIQLNSDGQAVVNVPWSNTQTIRQVKVDSNAALTSAETLDIRAGSNVTITEVAGVVTFSSNAASTRDSLNIDTDDDVAFKNLELSSGETGASANATIKGPAILTLDPRGHGDNSGKVVIAGDLQVDGTTTSVNSTTVEIKDLAIELAYDAGTSALINGAGIRLGKDGSGNAVHDFIYVHADSRMVLSSGLKVTGGLQNTVLTSCTIDGGTF